MHALLITIMLLSTGVNANTVSLKYIITVWVKVERMLHTKQSPRTGWSEILNIHWNPTRETQLHFHIYIHAFGRHFYINLIRACMTWKSSLDLAVASTMLYCFFCFFFQCMCKQWVTLPVAECGEAHSSRHESHRCGEGSGPTQQQSKHTGDAHREELKTQ